MKLRMIWVAKLVGRMEKTIARQSESDRTYWPFSCPTPIIILFASIQPVAFASTFVFGL